MEKRQTAKGVRKEASEREEEDIVLGGVGVFRGAYGHRKQSTADRSGKRQAEHWTQPQEVLAGLHKGTCSTLVPNWVEPAV